MAQPLRKPNSDPYTAVRATRRQIGLASDAAVAPADRSSTSSEDVRDSRHEYSRGLATAAAAAVLILSIIANAPLAGLAVLGVAIAIRWSLLRFGNWILDNTL